MKHLRVNKHTGEFETKISKDISFLRRTRNRILRWWVPISGATFVVAFAGISVATGNVVGITTLLNESVYNTMTYLTGLALGHVAARTFVFRKLTKRAKYENQIYKATKKSKKHFKKYNHFKENHNDLTLQAKNIVTRMASTSEADKKKLSKQYKSVRRKIDKNKIKIANSTMKLEGALTGRRVGPISRTLGVVTSPIRLLTRPANGLEVANDKYNKLSQKIRKSKKEKREVFGKFIYEGNVIESQSRLYTTHKELADLAATTKVLDAEAYKLTGKKYKPGAIFLQSWYRGIRHFTSDPTKLVEKIATRKTNYSKELHEEACKAYREGRPMTEPSSGENKTLNEQKGAKRASKTQTKQKTNNSKQYAYSEPSKNEGINKQFEKTNDKNNVATENKKQEAEKQQSEGKTL